MRPLRPGRLRETAMVVPFGAAVATAAVVATDVWSLRATAALLVVLVLGSVLVATGKPGLDGLAALLLTGSVATAPANGISVGLPPAAAMLVGALACLAVTTLIDRRPIRIPPWLWPLSAAIMLVAALHLVVPTELSYLATRVVDADWTTASGVSDAATLGAQNGARWLVAALALPVAVSLAAVHRPALPGLLANAWALGATASAAVALTDEAGLTTISESLLGTVDIGGRQAGLSVQPNHLAVTAALALPVVVWRALSARDRHQLYGWTAAAVVLAAGLFVTESRGGLVVGVASVLVVLLADRRARGALPALAGLGLAGVVVVVALLPSLLSRLAEQLRLSGADSAAQSDAIRRAVADQAIADFRHDPFRGVGLDVILQGHNIYLELLAAGGVLLLAGFVITFGGVLLGSWNLRRGSGDLAAVLGLCTAGWLVGGLVENQVADLYLYVPVALLAGMRAAARAPGAAGVQDTPTTIAAEPIGPRPT